MQSPDQLKKYAVIVAGGSGSRMGASTPKQFLELLGKPILYHTLTAFLGAYPDLHILLVLPAGHLQTGKKIIENAGDGRDIRLVEGGHSRFQSVKAGLKHVEPDSVVLVHDGVRCLVTAELIQRCFQVALEKGNAIPATACVDSLRIEKDGYYEAIDRSTVRLIQTPQAFHSNILKPIYESAVESSFTDEAGVAEAAGVRINLVEGEITNIKITSPIDLVIAEQLLKQRGT